MEAKAIGIQDIRTADHLLQPNKQIIRIKRNHGLGNVVCLLPVLDKVHARDVHVEIITSATWVDAFSEIRPEFTWLGESNEEFIDLDYLTKNRPPTLHRTDELGLLLGEEPPFESPYVKIPQRWSQKYKHLRDCVLFAPEGGHASRQWPVEHAEHLKQHLDGKPLVLIGTQKTNDIPCDVDLRGHMQLHDLWGILAIASVVITMDSGVLHLASALKTPTVALFGGIDYRYRIRPNQQVIALQSDLPCCPCNKNETCNDRFDCIKSPTTRDILNAVDLVQHTDGRIVYSVHTRRKPLQVQSGILA